jgi:hypothetical protein
MRGDWRMAMRSRKWLVLAALVTAAPDTPGVYELWDDDELLCLRSTHDGTLREALMHELLESGTRATHFGWEISFHPDARRRELLAELDLPETSAQGYESGARHGR